MFEAFIIVTCYLIITSIVFWTSLLFQNFPLLQRHRPLLAKQREVRPAHQTGRVRGGHVGDWERPGRGPQRSKGQWFSLLRPDNYSAKDIALNYSAKDIVIQIDRIAECHNYNDTENDNGADHTERVFLFQCATYPLFFYINARQTDTYDRYAQVLRLLQHLTPRF